MFKLFKNFDEELINKRLDLLTESNRNRKIEILELLERIKELEKIIKNQPLIKKYQKTLDIFMKNAQD